MLDVHEIIIVIIELQDGEELLHAPRWVVLGQHGAEGGLVGDIREEYVVDEVEGISIL